jgi:hypothetical protein
LRSFYPEGLRTRRLLLFSFGFPGQELVKLLIIYPGVNLHLEGQVVGDFKSALKFIHFGVFIGGVKRPEITRVKIQHTTLIGEGTGIFSVKQYLAVTL